MSHKPPCLNVVHFAPHSQVVRIISGRFPAVVAPRTTTVAPPPTTTLGAPAPIGCSNAMTDLAFVLDGSASVGEDGFVLLREFLVNLVSGFTNVGRNGVQVAMIQYNDNPRMEFQFHETGDNLTVLQAIDTLEYMGGNTNTGLALTFLQQAYINRENPRPTADKVAVIITDGRSQDDVIVPALLLKQEDVAIFAIGVGEAERIELEEMASDPISEFVFTVDDYSAIATIQEKLLKKICGVTRGVFRSAPGETSPEDEKLIPVLDGSESGTSDEDYFGSGELFYVDENP